MQDPFQTATDLARWQTLLPQAQTLRLNCDHFVPEERPTELSEALLGFMESA